MGATLWRDGGGIQLVSIARSWAHVTASSSITRCLARAYSSMNTNVMLGLRAGYGFLCLRERSRSFVVLKSTVVGVSRSRDIPWEQMPARTNYTYREVIIESPEPCFMTLRGWDPLSCVWDVVKPCGERTNLPDVFRHGVSFGLWIPRDHHQAHV